MPANGGTTCRFMRPRALQPPTIQLGNSGIDPPAQVPQRDIIDAQMAFFGTGCIISEQVILQDQEGVLAWVSERLAVAMRQASQFFGLYKSSLIDSEARWGNEAQAEQYALAA